jgi:DNA polymerase-3 subunit delta
MAQVSPEQLLARLASGKAIPALLLLGEEPYLRDECRARLIEKIVPEAARTWAVSRYSAGRGETQAALDQSQTMAMLSPQQVVFLEEADAIEKLGEKNREEAVAQLAAYLDNPAPFTVLVVEATSLDQRMKLGKMLAEKTLVVACGLAENAAGRQAAAVAFARTMGREKGVTFEQGAAEDLAEFVAADLMRLKTEIEKLATFAGERKFISRNDVTSMVISEKTTTVWELADLLAARNSAKALEFLDRLLRDGEEPLPMVGAMAWMYRKLIEASEVKGVTNGWQASRVLGMNPQQAELALQASRKIPKAQLLAGLRALQKADDRLKGGAEDERAVMEFLVTELSATAKASAAAGMKRRY